MVPIGVPRVICAGRKRHEDARRSLIVRVVRPTAERLRLGGGNPRHAEEQEEENGRDDPGHPSPRRRCRDERDAAPRDPLEEVVRVPRPGPEARPRRAAAVLGARPPPRELAVGGDQRQVIAADASSAPSASSAMKEPVMLRLRRRRDRRAARRPFAAGGRESTATTRAHRARTSAPERGRSGRRRCRAERRTRP